MKIDTLSTRIILAVCFFVACTITTAGEKNKVYAGQNLLPLPLPPIQEEPSNSTNSLLQTPNRSIEPAAGTPRSISVSITVTRSDNPEDKGFSFSPKEIAQLVELIPAQSSRKTIHQLVVASPVSEISDEVCAVKNEPAKNESDAPLRRCSLLHCLYVCCGMRV